MADKDENPRMVEGAFMPQPGEFSGTPFNNRAAEIAAANQAAVEARSTPMKAAEPKTAPRIPVIGGITASAPRPADEFVGSMPAPQAAPPAPAPSAPERPQVTSMANPPGTGRNVPLPATQPAPGQAPEVIRGLYATGNQDRVPGGVQSPIQQTREGNYINVLTGQVAGSPTDLKPESLLRKVFNLAAERDAQAFGRLFSALRSLPGMHNRKGSSAIAAALGGFRHSNAGGGDILSGILSGNTGMGRNIVADRASERSLEAERLGQQGANKRARIQGDLAQAAVKPIIGSIKHSGYDEQGRAIETEAPTLYHKGSWYDHPGR